jgi:3-methyladenine DNA glycosylase AlkD
LRDEADAKRAAGAQAYMKSAMPFYGTGATKLRTICKEVFSAYPLDDADAWRDATLQLWREATHREERYAAIELTGARGYRTERFQTRGTLAMYEEMIVSGAWWDYVDVIASNRIGAYLLRGYPAPMKKTLLTWAKGDDIWKRRSAIISQLTFKADTDLSFLERCIAPSFGRREFWLRKAIGWALRQYAWTDSRWVARYVRLHETDLAPLSKREALKNFQPLATRARATR